MFKISVIIVSYNSGTCLMKCLESIELYNDLMNEIEVIVVDNWKIDLLQESLIKYKAILNYELKYIHNPQNGGFGQGNNIGASLASGELLFFLNPDTLLIEPIFSSLYKAYRESKDNRIFGFKLLDKKYNVNNSYSFFPEYFYLYPLIGLIERRFFYLPNKISFVNRKIWPWGACFAISRCLFFCVGKFDENIFLCNEEPDLLQRIPERHVELLHKSVIHLEGHDAPPTVQRNIEYLKSLYYYCKKYELSFKALSVYMKVSLFVKMKLLHRKSLSLLNLKQAIICFDKAK